MLKHSQSTNQSTKEPTSTNREPTNISTKQSNHSAINQQITKPIKQRTKQSTNSTMQPIHQTINNKPIYTNAHIPAPFLPINPYLRPALSINEASVSKSPLPTERPAYQQLPIQATNTSYTYQWDGADKSFPIGHLC